jgi:hypothetical protein
MMPRILLFIILAGIFASCRPTEYTPKPAGYFKIDTPAVHEYKEFMFNEKVDEEIKGTMEKIRNLTKDFIKMKDELKKSETIN